MHRHRFSGVYPEITQKDDEYPPRSFPAIMSTDKGSSDRGRERKRKKRNIVAYLDWGTKESRSGIRSVHYHMCFHTTYLYVERYTTPHYDLQKTHNIPPKSTTTFLSDSMEYIMDTWSYHYLWGWVQSIAKKDGKRGGRLKIFIAKKRACPFIYFRGYLVQESILSS
ncbi:hypothetical protein GE21DRAFT_1035117 [Neurospora crassa]|nr:hypothetical protein GE21DRAFT_1035117 [Neurospora crassa]